MNMQIRDYSLLIRQLTKLIKEYDSKKATSADEFLEDKESAEHIVSEETAKNFLYLMKHDKLMNLMVTNFWSFYKLRAFNKAIITTLMYVIIFLLNEENADHILNALRRMQFKFSLNVVEYFTVEDNLIATTQAGCKVFENDYVLENILKPLLEKMNLIERVYVIYGREIKFKNAVFVKPLTVPVAPSCLQRSVKTPRSLLEPSSSLIPTFKHSKVPETIYTGDTKVQEALKKAREENRENASKLLALARTKAFRCAGHSDKKRPAIEEPLPSVIKRKPTKIPLPKDVPIKRNVATLMRDAAVLSKNEEKEIKRLEQITSGGFDPSTIEALENEMRQCKEKKYLQEIERKHLQGLLTHEESILAKQNLLKQNQENMLQFKEERETLLKELEEWRLTEQQKIKALVEKSQNIGKAARESEQNMIKQKQYNARAVDKEMKDLLSEAYVEKEKELARKIQIIQELRSLQQIRCLHVKQFDPTEAPNFGLLCEMSIAELQERLTLLKLELQEELKARRKAITDSKEKQQRLIESVKNFITNSRVSNPKPVPSAPTKLEQTPDLIQLRERLQQARKARVDAKQNQCS